MASGMESIVNRSEAFSLSNTTVNDYVGASLPVALIHGEDIRYPDRPDVLVLTNYRIIVHPWQLNGKKQYCDIPLGIVEQIEVVLGSCELIIYCRSGQTCRVKLGDQVTCEEWQQQLLKATKPLDTITKLFAFKHCAYCKDRGLHHHHDRSKWMSEEFQRMKMKEHGWKMTDVNSRYELCSTYPTTLMAPQYYQDDQFKKVAKFRKSGRVPAVVWRDLYTGCVIARSSQPQVGVWNWREQEDEKLLEDILRTCSLYDNGDRRLLIMDLRHYTAALANKATRGGGYEYEDYYKCCEVQFKGLPNIHAVQKSFVTLRSLISEADPNNFFSMLEQSHWLDYISQLLRVSNELVEAIAVKHQPVLVHCSDGWDRTSQVVSLAELLLDPYYRTIKGFQVLIEKEWLAFGHKFAERCGQSNCSSSEWCPIFLQWVECILHITRQFPTAFQFSEAFLVDLVVHTYSNKYGTLLGNSQREREKLNLHDNTESLWGLLTADDILYVNHLYEQLNKVIMPNDHVMCFKVWNELYSCLTHDYHDDQTDHVNIVTNHMQDDFSYHGYNDDITDDEHLSSHDIHCSSPFTMDTIQQRLRDLLHCPEEEKLSPNSNPTLTKEEAVDDHTSIKADNVENQHQWEMVTEEEATRTKWVPDHAATNCHSCSITFNKILYRKHHCRNCGNVFCNSCSNYFCPVPHELLTDPQRVCKKCFERLDNSSVVVVDHDVT